MTTVRVLAPALLALLFAHAAAAQSSPAPPVPPAPNPSPSAVPAPPSAESLEKKEETKPAIPAARFEQSGDSWMASGAYAEAIAAYQRAYELDPTDAVAHKLAVARTKAGTPAPPVLQPRPVAEPSPDEAPKERLKEKTNWYGYQPLLIDSADLALLVVGGATGSDTVMGLTLVPYLLGGPIVHAIHGRYATAGIDLGIRVAAPLASALVGAGIGAALGVGLSSGDGDSSTNAGIGAVIGAVIGFGVGIPAAIAIDASVLSREPVPAPRPSGFQWAPSVRPTKNGANLGVIGVF
jgi:hypothetical protein